MEKDNVIILTETKEIKPLADAMRAISGEEETYTLGEMTQMLYQLRGLGVPCVILYDVNQDLTDEEQSRARNNIKAASASDYASLNSRLTQLENNFINFKNKVENQIGDFIFTTDTEAPRHGDNHIITFINTP